MLVGNGITGANVAPAGEGFGVTDGDASEVGFSLPFGFATVKPRALFSGETIKVSPVGSATSTGIASCVSACFSSCFCFSLIACSRLLSWFETCS